MKLNQILAVLIVVVLAFLLARYAGFWRTVTTRELKIGSVHFRVEIADTPIARAQGLSGREFLAPDEGMLFLFPFAGTQAFWMKDMKFPIDIIWIRDKEVVGMVIGAEPPEGDSGPATYTSPEAADTVLEINAGLTQRLGIKVGDIIDF